MPNNITPLEDELKARAKENAALAAENFSQNGLTDEEREKVAAMEAESLHRGLCRWCGWEGDPAPRNRHRGQGR